MMYVEEWYCVEVDSVIRTTEAAVLLRVATSEDDVLDAEGHERDIWVPKSQLTNGSEYLDVGGAGEVCVSIWFAEQRGWIDGA